MDQYYGISFGGENKPGGELIKTYLPVGQAYLELMSDRVKSEVQNLSWEARWAFIKELKMNDKSVVLMNKPATFEGMEGKLAAFILQRRGEIITQRDNVFLVNGKEIDFDFGRYKVDVIEIE